MFGLTHFSSLKLSVALWASLLVFLLLAFKPLNDAMGMVEVAAYRDPHDCHIIFKVVHTYYAILGIEFICCLVIT